MTVLTRSESTTPLSRASLLRLTSVAFRRLASQRRGKMTSPNRVMMPNGAIIRKISFASKVPRLTHASGSPRPSSSKLVKAKTPSVSCTLRGNLRTYVSPMLVTIW